MEGPRVATLRLTVSVYLIGLACQFPDSFVHGGQLDRIRKQTKKPSESKKDRDSDASDESHDHKTKSGKLSQIRANAVRHSAPRTRRPNRRPRRRPYFAPSLLSSVHCYPPVVEEHVHIYEAVPVDPAATVVFPNEQPYSPVVEPAAPIWEPAEPWDLQLSLEYGIPLDDVSHFGTEFILQTPSRWGIDTRFALKLEDGAKDFRDSLWNGEFNVTYQVVRTANLRIRAGVGLNWIGDSFGGEVGPNLMIGSRWQPAPQCSLDGYLAVGTLGRADMIHGRLTAGYQLAVSEVYTGIDHYQVGGEAINSWITGLRFRF